MLSCLTNLRPTWNVHKVSYTLIRSIYSGVTGYIFLSIKIDLDLANLNENVAFHLGLHCFGKGFLIFKIFKGNNQIGTPKSYMYGRPGGSYNFN